MSGARSEVERPARVHHLPAAVVAAAATALLVLLPRELGDQGLLVAVAVLQLALIASWAPATGLRGGAGAMVIGVGAAVAADLLLTVPDRPDLGALAAVPALAFLAAVLHQMLRRPPRQEVVGSLAGVALLVCAVCSLALLLRVPEVAEDDRVVATVALVVGVALVAGHLVDAVVPRPPVAPGIDCGVPGLLVAVLAGVAVALVRHPPGGPADTVSAVTFGLVLAAVAVLVGLVASYVVAARPHGLADRALASPLLQTVLPFAASGPVAFTFALQAAF